MAKKLVSVASLFLITLFYQNCAPFNASQFSSLEEEIDNPSEPPTTSRSITAFSLECSSNDQRLPTENLLMGLNRYELENTLVDLFDPYFDATQRTQFLNTIRPFINNIPKNTVIIGMDLANHDVTAIHVERHFLLAEAVADYVASQTTAMNRLLGSCSANRNTDACKLSFIDQFGRRALRRSVDTDSRNYYLQVMNGHTDSYRNIIVSMVSSPFFYYHNQFGDGSANSQNIQLDAFERANKLSYFMLQSMPDDELFQSAVDGSIMTNVGFIAQVDRLLTSEKVRRRLTRFFANQWLHLDKTAEVRTDIREVQTMLSEISNPNPSTFRTSLIEEVYDYVDHMIWVERASYAQLMTSPLVFPRNAALANIYGTAQWNGQSDPTSLVRAPSSERAGVLTRAQFLYTGTGSTRPIMRGVHVYQEYMCQELNVPADNATPQGVVLTPTMTDQEVVKAITEVPRTSCVGCHQNIINPLGFAFDNFDSFGKFRNSERVFHAEGSAQQGQVLTTRPVNSNISMTINNFITGQVSGAADFSRRLGENTNAQACFSSKLWNFAQKNNGEVDENPCAVRRIYNSLEASNGSIIEAIKTVATQPEFTKRRAK